MAGALTMALLGGALGDWCSAAVRPADGATSPTAATPAAATPADDPWELLRRVRERLVTDGAVVADFVQTYVPAGFTSGERESGRLAMALPTCLRWDYELPYAKSFLLCGKRAYVWNQGEKSGRLHTVDADREPGLDLLLLSLEALRQRYRAGLAGGGEAGRTVTLAPLAQNGETGPLAHATLVLDHSGEHLAAVAWSDTEGNVTRFELSGYRSLAAAPTFTPPAGIEWEQE